MSAKNVGFCTAPLSIYPIYVDPVCLDEEEEDQEGQEEISVQLFCSPARKVRIKGKTHKKISVI